MRLPTFPVPSFAGFATNDDEMRLMSRRLRRIRNRNPSMVGHGNAGLASNFIDLAHTKVRSPGGVLALVLPASFLQGEAWAAARRLLEEHYRDVVLVSIATFGTTDRAFSADTGMAEVLVIATRRGDTDQTGRAAAQFVNLLRRPQSILEASTVARSIQRIPADRPAVSIPISREERAGCSIWSVLNDMGCGGPARSWCSSGGERLGGRGIAATAVPGTLSSFLSPDLVRLVVEDLSIGTSTASLVRATPEVRLTLQT